jgi:hypothetical protein
MLTGICLALLAHFSHPLSLSRLALTAEETGLNLTWHVQALTLMELPNFTLDINHDESLSQAEVLPHWQELRLYLESRFFLRADDMDWTPTFDTFEITEGGKELLVRATLPWEQLPEVLVLTTDHFFADGNPSHRMHVRVTGLTPEPQLYLLSQDIRSAIFPLENSSGGAEPHSIFPTYLKLGFEHVLLGWDHLAFLLALLFGIAGGKALFGAVTAFTLAHSITLSLAALQIFLLPRSLVEPIIAASILLVLWWHLYKGTNAKAWKPAFGFGLIHGFGFAGALQGIGMPKDALTSSLLGFNIGVEAGQLAFVLPAFFLFRVSGKAVRSAAALFLAAAAFHFMIQTAGWWLPVTLTILGYLCFRRLLDSRPYPMKGTLQSWLILGCYWVGTQF